MTLVDSDDAACTASQTLGPLNPCSTTCALTIDEVIEVCNDDNTPSDGSDDFYIISVNASAVNAGPSGTFEVFVGGVSIPGGPYTYGVGGTFQLPADNTSPTLTLVDTDDAACTASQTLGPLVSCSTTCVLTITNLTETCNINGTLTDISDDFYSVVVNATALNEGPSGSFNVLDAAGGYVAGPFPYGVGGAFNLNADGSSPVLTIADADDITCSVSQAIGPLNPCSVVCDLAIDNIQITDATCGQNNGILVINASGGTGPLTYNIGTGGSPNNTFNNLAPNNYTVTVTDVNGCTAVDNVTIQDIPATVYTLSNSENSGINNDDGIICSGAAVTLSVTPNTGTFNWSESGAGGSSITVSPTATTNYTVTVTDGNGCTSILNATVVVNSATTGLEDYVGCTGDGYTVTVNGNTYGEGTPLGTIETLVNAAGCDSIVTINLVYNSPTTGPDVVYNGCSGDGFTVVVNGNTYGEGTPLGTTETMTNYLGCDSTVTINLVYSPLPTPAITGLLNVCIGETTTLTATPGYVSYEWSGTLGTSETVVAGAGTHSVTVTDSNGCEGVASVTVVENALGISLSITSDYNGFGVSCSGGADGVAEVTVATGTPPYSYNWSNFGTEATATGLEAGVEYFVTVVDAIGCSSVESVTLSAPNPPTVVASFTPPTCHGDLDATIVIDTAFGGIGSTYTYSIDNGTYYQPDSLFAFLGSGTYEVIVSDENGCTGTTTVEIPVIPEPFLDLGADIQLDLGDSVQLNGVTNLIPDTIIWDPMTADMSCTNCLNPVVQPEDDILYTLTVADANGCTATDDILIEVLKNRDVYIPNVFSPNQSGYNDIFTVYGSGQIRRVVEMKVYDRWGEMVYEAEDFPVNTYNIGWDGTFRGKDMDPAVFVYYVIVEYIDGEEEMFKGDVTLVR